MDQIEDRGAVYAAASTGTGPPLPDSRSFGSVVFDASNSVIVVLDLNGRILRFNPAAERVSGYQAEEVCGRFVWEVLVAPEQVDEVRGEFMRGPLREGWHSSVNWRTRSGEMRRLTCSVTVVGDRHGDPAYLVGTGVDITDCCRAEERAALAEERYRRLVELSFCLEVVQCDGRIVHVNERGARFLGAESAEEFVGRPITDIYPPEYHGIVLERIRFAAEQWQPTSMAERQLLRVDGSRVDVEAAAIPVIYGGRVATHAVFRDVSERKRNEQELERYRGKLEELVAQRTTELVAVNREMEAFSHSVSHDLRAPLRAINGFSGALLEDAGERLDEDAQYYVHRIQANTERMSEIIDNLLTLSGVLRRPIEKKRVDVSEVAEAVVEELRVAEPDRTVAVTIEEGMEACGDPALLRVVLQNLIGNAWKYTAREPAAHIEFCSSTEETGRVFCVRDNGVGFDTHEAEELFAAFHRLHSHQEFEGSGIGLATVKRIVQRHGGSIWAEGEEGRGAHFCFRLPVPPGDSGCE